MRLTKGIVQGAWRSAKAMRRERSRVPPRFQVWAVEGRKNIGRDCLGKQESDVLNLKDLSNSNREYEPSMSMIHIVSEECVTPHQCVCISND